MSIRILVERLLGEIKQLPPDDQAPMRELVGQLIEQITRHLHDNRELAARSTR